MTTKKFDVIYIDEELSVVVDKIQPEIGDYKYHEDLGLSKFNGFESSMEDRKVIATIGKQVEGLPLVVLPEEENILGEMEREFLEIVGNNKYVYEDDDYLEAHYPDAFILKKYINKYKAAQQKGGYTKDNLEQAFKAGLEAARRLQDEDRMFDTEVAYYKNFLQSLQKKHPVAVELKGHIISQWIADEDKHGRQENFILEGNPDNTIHPVNVFYL